MDSTSSVLEVNLNKSTIRNPIQNSNPAKANKKKVVDVKVTSSLIEPTTLVYVYSNTQIVSEYIIRYKRFWGLNKNKKIITHIINVIKFIKLNDIFFKIIQVLIFFS